MHCFDLWVERCGVEGVGVERFAVGGLFAGGGGDGPLGEIVEAPGAQMVCVGLRRVGGRVGHIAAGDPTPTGGPFVRVAGLQGGEGVADVGRV